MTIFWKSSILLIFVTFAGISRAQNEFDSVDLPELDSGTQEKLARIISLIFLKYYFNGFQIHANQSRSPSNDKVSYDYDQLKMDDWSIEIPRESDLAKYVYGNASFCNVVMRGLTAVRHEFNTDVPDPPGGTLMLSLTAESLRWDGRHKMALNFLEGKINLTSSDLYYVGISRLDFTLNLTLANISIFSKIELAQAEVDLAIGAFHLYFENAALNGEELIEEAWDELSEVVTQGFASIWTTFKPIVDLLLMSEVKELIEKCRLVDLASGEFSCIAASSGKSGLDGLILEEMSDLLELSDSDVCPVERPGGDENLLPALPTNSDVAQRGEPRSTKNSGVNFQSKLIVGGLIPLISAIAQFM